MKTPLDHARCSELLGDYLRGSLDAHERNAVHDHLAGCRECEEERRGLAALIADPDPALTSEERVRLHAGVTAQISQIDPVATVIVSKRSFGARLYPALGAAAVLIGLIAGGVYLSGTDTNEEGLGADAALREQVQSDESGGAGQGAQSPRGAALRAKNAPAASDAVQGATAEESDFFEASGVFDRDAGELSRRSLRRLGHREEPFVSLTNSLTVADVPDVRDEFLESLLGKAPDAFSEDVRSCARSVFESDDTSVVAYGALGRYEKKEVLALGFLASPGDRGPLDRYQIWLWPRGDCSFPREVFSGAIRPQ